MPEFVYLVRSGDTTKYKFGKTNDLVRRLKELNGKQSADEILLIFSIEVIDSLSIEKTLQNKYKKYHHRNEWFNLTDEQVENVRQDMNFLQFNEQIFYKTDYSNIPVKSADIDLIQNNLETYLKNGRYQVSLRGIHAVEISLVKEFKLVDVSLSKGFKLVQLALVKGFINLDHFVDIGINFFLEEDYELALMYFNLAHEYNTINIYRGGASLWIAETLFHCLKIQSRKESNDQCDTDSEYKRDIVFIERYYWIATDIYNSFNFEIDGIKSMLGTARAYHARAIFTNDYMDTKDIDLFRYAEEKYKEFNCLNIARIVSNEAETRIKNMEQNVNQ